MVMHVPLPGAISKRCKGKSKSKWHGKGKDEGNDRNGRKYGKQQKENDIVVLTTAGTR